MKTCMDCTHWKQDEAPWCSEKLADMAAGTPWGECQKIEHSDGSDKYRGIAHTMDGSDYHSELDTRSDFGCILFELTE